jgi:hypothetical protein
MIIYKISGYNISLYCKITEYGINTENYMCTMSFGTGNKQFCLTSIYKSKKLYEIYIDRVDKNNLCVIDGKLSDFEEGLVKLVKVSLWFIKKIYPHVKKFTLFDYSQIYCNPDNKHDKLSLAYDYILKYNQTWYEKKFKAELPGLITTNKNTTIESNSLMAKYKESLKELDAPLMSYDIIADKLTVLQKYKSEYTNAETPRQFIENIRNSYKDNYCYEVGKWLNSYMVFLQIKLFPEEWYILTSNVNPVPNFKVNKITNASIINKFLGGRRNTRKKYPFKLGIGAII